MTDAALADAVSACRVLVCDGSGGRDSGVLASIAAALPGVNRVLIPAGERGANDLALLASDATVALVAVDDAGLTEQVCRELHLLALMHVPELAVVVDTPDGQERTARLERELEALAAAVGIRRPACVPIADLDRLGLLVRAGRRATESSPPVRCERADQLEAHLIWLDDVRLVANRTYLFEAAGVSDVQARVTRLKHRLDLGTGEHLAATTLAAGEVGVANLMLERTVEFAPYAQSRERGLFRLHDRTTGRTVAVGMIHFALRRASNVKWQSLAVTKADHAMLNGHRPCVVWLTGLSGAGKSTIANGVEQQLHARGVRTCLLDGDNVRHGLCVDLGFTEPDRVENIRRVAEVAKLMVGAGLVVIVSLISPFRTERTMARALFEPGEFFEVFVDAPLDVAEARDPKGLYRKARRGELPGFTGIDSPYEAPEAPELHLQTAVVDPSGGIGAVVEMLAQAGILDPPD
jgi:adenylyl-sulfate kinase